MLLGHKTQCNSFTLSCPPHYLTGGGGRGWGEREVDSSEGDTVSGGKGGGGGSKRDWLLFVGGG